MAFDASWLILAFFVAWTLLKLSKPSSVFSYKSDQAQPPGAKAKIPHLLKPRSENDCSLCREAKRKSAKAANQASTVRPWREFKSLRGRPKQIHTEGFACCNSACRYFGVKDQQIHALVGDGKQGKTEQSQTFKCQACQKTFSARKHTPLYRLKTPSTKVSQVLMALAEGVALAACERIFGFRAATIATWLSRSGEHSQRLHAHFMKGLTLPHLQLDEIRTRLRSRAQVLWLWLSIDPATKLIPALAHQLVHQIKLVLTAGSVPIFSSDGLNHITANNGLKIAKGALWVIFLTQIGQKGGNVGLLETKKVFLRVFSPQNPLN